MRSKKIKIPIYDGLMFVHIFKDDEDKKTLEKKYGLTCTNDYDAFAFAHKHGNGGNSYHVCLGHDAGCNVIAHECYHFVSYFCRDHGIKLEHNNDEAPAYLMGWAVEWCHKLLK